MCTGSKANKSTTNYDEGIQYPSSKEFDWIDCLKQAHIFFTTIQKAQNDAPPAKIIMTQERGHTQSEPGFNLFLTYR